MERDPAWGRVVFLEIWPSVLVAEPKVRKAADGFGRRVMDTDQQGVADKKLARL